MPEREFVSVLDTCENDVYKLVYSVGLRARYQCGAKGLDSRLVSFRRSVIKIGALASDQMLCLI